MIQYELAFVPYNNVSVLLLPVQIGQVPFGAYSKGDTLAIGTMHYTIIAVVHALSQMGQGLAQRTSVVLGPYVAPYEAKSIDSL